MLCKFADAQVISPKGRFSVDFSNGCPPYKVTLTTFNNGQTPYYTLKYSSENNYYRGNEFLQQIDATTQTFTIDKIDAEILLIQAIETGGTPPVERDTIRLKSYAPQNPAFRVYACSNNQVVAEVTDRSYDFYEVYFGSSTTPARADNSNNYTAASQSLPDGTAPVRVQGRYNNSQDNCGSNSASALVFNNLPKPVWRGLQWNIAQQTVSLQYSLNPQVKYQLERFNAALGSFEKLFNISGTSADTTFSQAGLSSQFFCYRLVALDLCGGSSTPSEELCTASFELSALDGYNQVKYQTNAQFTGTVQLLRADGTVVESQTLPEASLIDNNVVCQLEYCYTLKLQPAHSPGVTAESSALCVLSNSTQPLPPARNVVTAWEDNQLIVKPVFPAFYKNFTLSLLDQGGKQLGSSTADSLLYRSTPAANCYLFSYSSACASQPASTTEICPLFLFNAADEPDQFIPSWNQYMGYAEGVAYYELQEIDANGHVINSWNMGNSTSDPSFPAFSQADNGRRFRVAAYPAEAGILPSFSNIFVYELIMKGYFPNAFSPNSDGVNDDFRILGKFVSELKLLIYNRWGEVVFFTESKENAWNGMHKGSPAPAGAYAYKAEVTTADGKRSTLSGTVFLKR